MAKTDESSKLDELREISTPTIAGLVELKQQHDQLEGFIEKMQKLEDKAEDRVVFEKVRSDYMGRLNDLQRKAEPIVAEARKSYQSFLTLHEQITREFQRSRQAKAELEIRHAVGEFDDDVMREKMSEVESSYIQCEAEVREADELKDKFLAAFPKGVEFEPAAGPSTSPGPAKAPAKAPAAKTPPAAAASGEDSGVDRTVIVDASVPGAAPKPKPAASAPVEGGTLIIPPARLIAKEGGKQYPLGACMSIGRDGNNQIRLEEAGVSRKHATVAFGSGGFTIKDEQSHYGTFVNDERIKEQRLKDGDRVRIGAVEMVFKESDGAGGGSGGESRGSGRRKRS